MERRRFLELLGSGALLAMLAPSVARAYQDGRLTEDQLFALLQDGSDNPVLIQQDAQVVGKVLSPCRWKVADTLEPEYPETLPRGTVPMQERQVIEMQFEVTGPAEDRDYWVSDDSGARGGPRYHQGSDWSKLHGWGETRRRKFIPGRPIKVG